MQNLDIISVNIWHILIALLNLVILFFIVKKFLYGPVKNMLNKRREEIDNRYSDAETAKQSAICKENELNKRLAGAETEAEEIVKDAAKTAKIRESKIIDDAKAEAENIIRQAKAEAELEKKRADAAIKSQIVDVSTALSEKMLEREINADDHKALIDSFIEKIGEDDDSDR